jgi:hypothetical protein
MDISQLTALANELLTCYWDSATAEDMAAVCAKYGTTPSSAIFHQATAMVEEMLSGTGKGYGLISPANRSRMLSKCIQTICQETGAELGKDISFTDGGVLIRNDLLQPFLDDLPPERRAEFEAKGYVQPQPQQDPFAMLEASLGVPFFSSLESIAKLRVATLDNGEAGAYLGMLFDGLTHKHPWISPQWIYGFSERVLGADRLEQLKNSDGTVKDIGVTSALLFGDLLIALGFTELPDGPDHGLLLCRDSLLALDKVFRGANRSIAELAELIRRASP